MSAELVEQMQRLAAFEPNGLPVLSLYLNTQSGQSGRDSFTPFLKKELRGRAKTFAPRSETLESYEKDVARIEQIVAQELQPSANGLVIFACSGANEFLEVIQLQVPIERHELYVEPQPHLYGLARLDDQFPRYAAVLADTNSARLFVISLNQVTEAKQVENTKTTRTKAGGWSQARYQRHTENYHLQHAKEVVDVLERVVREEGIQYIILSGDEVVIPMLRAQLPPALEEKVIDILRLDITTPEHKVLTSTLEAIKRHDAITDAERVERIIGDYRGGGLAAVGVADVLAALENGQVDEVLLSAAPDQIEAPPIEAHGDIPAASGEPEAGDSPSLDGNGGKPQQMQVAEEIVRRASQTAATVRFIESAELLAPVGGVAASLRYRL